MANNCIYGQCVRCGKNLTNNHVCDFINQPEAQKTDGLRMKDLEDDTDILLAEFPNKNTDRFPWQWSRYNYENGDFHQNIEDKEPFYAPNWRVLRRKSNKENISTIQILETMLKKEIEMVTGYGTEWVKLADYNQLQEENESLRNKLENINTFTWKNWPEEKPSKSGMILFRNCEGFNIGIECFYYDLANGGIFKFNGMKITLPSSFQFLELPG